VLTCLDQMGKCALKACARRCSPDAATSSKVNPLSQAFLKADVLTWWRARTSTAERRAASRLAACLIATDASWARLLATQRDEEKAALGATEIDR
jgi:hypothetical protein